MGQFVFALSIPRDYSISTTILYFLWNMLMSSTSLFVIKFSMKSSISGRLQPIIRGDLNMAHSVSIVYCSSGVKLLIRGVPLMALCAIGPMGSISASGQCPLQIYFCHFRQSGNCSFRASQSSQKSSEMQP